MSKIKNNNLVTMKTTNSEKYLDLSRYCCQGNQSVVS